MNILVTILIVIASIIVLLLLLAAVLKKKYSVIKSVEINKPKAQVFDYIKHLKNQDNYSVWANRDPNMKKEYKGTDATVGFVSAWDSKEKNVGKGEQEILKITEGERLDFELRFLAPFEATEKAYMTTESLGAESTRVSWGFDGGMKYPMNLMLLFMNMEKMIGDDLESGLKKLKEVLEA